MPSDGPPPFRRGGDGLTWRDPATHQAFLSGGGAPRHCGRRLPRNAASDTGQHGFPASVAAKRSEAVPCVSPFAPGITGPARKGVLVVRSPPRFWTLVRHGRVFTDSHIGA